MKTGGNLCKRKLAFIVSALFLTMSLFLACEQEKVAKIPVAKNDSETKVASEAKPVAKLEQKPEIKAQIKQESKPEVKPEIKPETKAAAKDTGRVGRFTDTITGMEFILVKGGCFQMGDTFGDGKPDEQPVHEVCVDDFYMGKYEVTQGQWKSVLGKDAKAMKPDSAGGSFRFSECGDNCPVEKASWNDTQEFISVLNEISGKRYRLPTEAEWEYAARSGGKSEKWAGTSSESDLGNYAWYGSNANGNTEPVGQKKPNGLGLYDMTGNVEEWCSDRYGEKYYINSSKSNPKGPDAGSKRVLRGGSVDYNAQASRSSLRHGDYPNYRKTIFAIGFRVAVSTR
jgi:formylglycine-generating enzyme required for sulfatase activity